MCIRPLDFFQCGDRLYTPESDVLRRQILTYKYGPALKGLRIMLAFAPAYSFIDVLIFSYNCILDVKLRVLDTCI